MSHPTPDPNAADGSVYDGLLEHEPAGDAAHWAFGTDFEDPLAGVDTTIPEGVALGYWSPIGETISTY